MDLSTITDINALKVMKADQYDLLELHTQGVEQAKQSVLAINTRLSQLNPKAPEDPSSTTTESTTVAPDANSNELTGEPAESASN